MGSGQPQLSAEPGGGGVTPFKARLKHSKTPVGIWDYSWRGLRCERPICSLHTARAPEQSRSSSSSSRKRCRRRRRPHRRLRNSSRRNPRQQGQGRQEGVEQEGRGRMPCALAGTTCPLPGAAGKGGMAAITDSTGSVVRQGRPREVQGQEKSGVSSQTPRGPWDSAMHPYMGRCRRPCFMVRISCRGTKAVQDTAERLKQSLGYRRGGRKKNAVTAVVSLNRSTRAGRTRMRRNSISDQPRNRIFR